MTILHSVDFGPRDAQPVVFLGSIASTTDMWLPQLDSLSKDFRVIAIDHPGHGQSPDPQALPGDTTINDLANNVLDTCLLYTSPSPRDRQKSRMPSSA